MAKTKKIRTREVTFEGKNIHFSPLDNKPLCSFSNKLCRQRRLNGYAFCIRHILEDKSSPFKQCDYVTRNNGQRCLNAIPSNQERGYCHSHMQVAGIIPKTERKIKPSNPGSSSGNGKNSDSKKENKKNASVSVQKDNNQNCPAISTKAAPATKNCQVENPSLPTKSKGKAIASRISNATKLGNEASTGKLSLTGKTSSISVLKTEKLPLQKNGNLAKKTAKPKQTKPLLGQLVNQPKKQLNRSSSAAKLDTPNAYLDSKFHQLKTFNLTDFPLDPSNFDAKLLKIEPSRFDIPLIPRLEGVDDFCLIPPFLQLHKNTCNAKPVKGRRFEARQEFLSSVRSAFKAHYSKFRRAYKLGQSLDEGNKSIVETLMSSALSEGKIPSKLLRNPQTEITPKAEQKLGNHTGDKSFHTVVNSLSNNSKTVANNKIAAPVQLNGGVKYINPNNLLRDFDENFVLDQVKDDRLCGDSSPWMNGGMNDYALGIGKKGRSSNHSNKQFAHYTDGQTPSVSTQIRNASSLINSAYGSTDRPRSISNHLSNLLQGSSPIVADSGIDSHVVKKRRLDLDNDFDELELEHNLCLDLHGSPGDESHILCPPHYSSVAHFETVLNSVSSSDTAGTPEGVITDASFDSPFDHSTSSHPDCDFSDDVDDLEKTFELQIDPEIAHQASRLLENNELTEDDFNELFPETRSLSDHKLGGDLGIDFDADIDYSLFANIFPNFRSNNPSEAISVAQNF